MSYKQSNGTIPYNTYEIENSGKKMIVKIMKMNLLWK